VTAELFVLLGDHTIGRLTRATAGLLAFEYDEAWLGNESAYPLSISMPLARARHSGDVVAAYLWGLLPDNEIILDGWAKRFKVSARNPFALLANVGEDCPGAVRFVTAGRRERVAREKEKRREIAWLDDHAIAKRLRGLHRDASAWREATDTGQFSLGGAQPKTALFSDGKRWGVPSGRVPTTHIFKPGSPDLEGHAENEHFCLVLAGEAGLPVARSRVMRFEDEVAIVVERYDRLRDGNAVLRVHQEDCCQALGVLPVNKYENVGGPGVRAIATLLRERSRSSQEDLDTFLGALAFNWVVAGTDAHAKNYSVLVGRGGELRLAPLYDIASFLPYAKHGLRKLTLAMKIGGTYRLHDIGVHAWEKLAKEVGRDPEEERTKVAAMCEALPDLCAAVYERTKDDGLSHRGLPELTRKIQERARACARALRSVGK
jgi:serine/threonine-protein kinase HipA